MTYKMMGTERLDELDVETLVTTHPAPPGTFVIYAHKDGSHNRTPAVLWGVLMDGTPVPITLSGVWDGTVNRNKFVLHPDGYCSDFDNSWDTLDAALAEMKAHDDH